MPKKIFVDSDVVISSLISSSGAAYFLLNQISNLKFYISNISHKELIKVAERLKINQEKLKNLLQGRFIKVQLKETLVEIKLIYSEYVEDIDDTHVVAGAKEAGANFLVSYNTRHFKVDKTKQDFNIAILTPAMFLQYLRSTD